MSVSKWITIEQNVRSYCYFFCPINMKMRELGFSAVHLTFTGSFLYIGMIGTEGFIALMEPFAERQGLINHAMAGLELATSRMLAELLATTPSTPHSRRKWSSYYMKRAIQIPLTTSFLIKKKSYMRIENQNKMYSITLGYLGYQGQAG
jgi:hypothetical protein